MHTNPFSCINVEREVHRSIVKPGQRHHFMLRRETHSKWHCPSPVPSPRAAEAILVHKARGEGQGEGTCSILCNIRVHRRHDVGLHVVNQDTAAMNKAPELKLKEGDRAPDFTAPGGGGKVSLADFKGKNVVLYFYP